MSLPKGKQVRAMPEGSSREKVKCSGLSLSTFDQALNVGRCGPSFLTHKSPGESAEGGTSSAAQPASEGR